MHPGGPETLIGQDIAGYRLERLLGVGLAGAVYLGRHGPADADAPLPSLPSEVAVKVLLLPWQLTEGERSEFQARFALEGELLAKFNHPGIIWAYSASTDAASGISYILLPYLSGGTLSERVGRRGPLALAEISHDLSRLADALDYVHRAGIVHRDVKTSNVLLDANGEPILHDFGIAAPVSDHSATGEFQGLSIGELFRQRNLTDATPIRETTGRILGTPAYLAPEAFLGYRPTPAGDLYGLGVVTYELVTGEVPFRDTSFIDLATTVRNTPPPRPSKFRPDLPAPADAAILKALAKAPEDRFQSASMFAEAFAQGLQGQWTAGLQEIYSSSVTQPLQTTIQPRSSRGGWFPLPRLIGRASEGWFPAFVSYSRSDQRFVDQLEREMRAREVDAWIDRRKLEGGQMWAREIEKAITRCQVCVVVLSPQAVVSPYVQQEYELALKKRKIVVPLLYLNCDVPDVLRRIHWIDCIAQPIEDGLADLIKALDYYARVKGYRRQGS